MPGPWEKYQAAPASGDGPWSKYAAAPAEAPAPAGDSMGAGIEGFGQGALAGHLAQAQAAASKPIYAALNMITGQNVQPDSYVQERDANIARQTDLAKSNPYAYYGGQVGGMIATAPVGEAAAAKVLEAAPAALAASRIAKGAVTGGLLAGAQNPGDTEGVVDPLQAGQRATAAGVGAVGGAAIAGAAPYVGQAASAVGGKLSDKAEWLAAKALGAERGTVKKFGEDKILAAGRAALDNGVISPLASTDTMIARNAAAKTAGGEAMGKVYQTIDNAGASTFNPTDVANQVEKELGGFYRSPINSGETRQLDNTIASIKMRGDGPLPLEKAQELKEELGKVANWKNNLVVSDKERMARQAYGIVSSGIDDAAAKGAKTVGADGLSEALSQGKQAYGNAKTAESLLENKQAREQGNKLLGMTDWMLLGGSGAAHAATGGASVPATAAALVGKKLIEKYGSQNAALVLDKLGSSLASRAPEMAEAMAAHAGNIGRLTNPASGASALAPAAAQSPAPTKGPEKWANDGLDNLEEHDDSASLDRSKLLSDPKARQLLIAASVHKPGSPAMKDIAKKLGAMYGNATS